MWKIEHIKSLLKGSIDFSFEPILFLKSAKIVKKIKVRVSLYQKVAFFNLSCFSPSFPST